MARNQAVTVILDKTKHMFAPFAADKEKTNLDVAFESILMLYQQKLLYAGKCHKVALMTYNDTDYEFLQKYDTVSLEMTRELRKIKNDIKEPEEQHGDVFLSLAMGVKEIRENYKKRKCKHTIYLLTSMRGESCYDEGDLTALIETLNEYGGGIKINVICFDMDDHNDKIKRKNFMKFRTIEDKCTARMFSAEDALEIYQQLQTKVRSLTTKYRGVWEIAPSLKLSVMGFSKSVNTGMKSMKKFSKSADYDPSIHSGKIQTEKTSFSYEDPTMTPVPNEHIIRGYEYGNCIVPIPKELADSMSVRDEEKCLVLLGFTEKKNVPRHHYLGGTDMFVPGHGEENTLCFNSIIQSMMEAGKLGIARYTMRKNSPPRLVGLHPDYVESIGYVFYVVQIPTAEDIREYNFASLEPATEVQKDKIGELIKSMGLMGDGEEVDEKVVPSEMYNPIMQYLDQNLMERAFNGATEVVDMDPRFEEGLYPERATKEETKAILAEIKEMFKLEEKEMKEIASSRVFWKEIAKGKIENEEIVEGGEQEEIPTKGKGDIDDNIIREISPIHPISDFKEMIGCKKEDLVEAALKQMSEMIIKLVEESVKVSHISKAFECMMALRKGCINEEEGDFFNEFLISLKSKVPPASKTAFWNMIIRKGVSLISITEEKSSSVDETGATEFLKDLEGLLTGKMIVEEPDDEDDLDELE